MIKSYLTLAVRIMIGQRGFVFINVSGLTIGIACSLLLFLYIQDELGFDRFHPDAERIYRIGFDSKLQGNQSKSAETGAPVAAELQKFGGVETTLRLANWPTFPIRYKDKAFTEPYLLLADSNFFTFFNFELVHGSAAEVLTGKDKLVITESTAKKYFGYKGTTDSSPLGKSMVLAQGYEAKVAGIAKDPPVNAHFHFTILLSLSSWTELQTARWTNGVVLTYAKLKPGVATTALTDFLNTLTTTKINEELKQIYGTTLQQLREQGSNIAFFVQPLTAIHLHSNLADEIEANGNIQYIYLFGIIAVFITLLACINFMNLSTARSTSRAKEVGVRKAVGAIQSRLMSQFLVESFLYTLLSVICALGMVRLLLLPFNILTGKQIGFSIFLQPLFLTGLIGFVVVITFLAGSYPSLYLARFNPIEVLKGKVRMGRRKYGIRNTLVVFQFFISITLIIATLVVYRQLQFIQNRNTGFNKENIINLLHTANLRDKAEAFKKDLLAQPEIANASFANRLPPNIDWQSVFRLKGNEKGHLLAVYEMDHDHMATLGFSMKSGRFFSRKIKSDSLAIILNETAARSLGIPASFDSVRLISTYESTGAIERNLIGIMNDFNFKSLREPIQPLAIVLSREPNWEMAIRLAPGNVEKALEMIQTTWKKHAPEAPFEYTFVDQNFRAKYQREQTVGTVFLIFTVLAILIACLGVFGLATYMAEQRTKEIGIRKVLGANSLDVVLLLTLDFAKLIGIAFVVSSPIAWWALSSWLDQYAYHISLPITAFVLAAFLALLLALISASHRALKAALSNPVESLRTE